MKRVLLTGATGFIGRCAIQPLLESGYEVHAVSSKPQRKDENIVWHQADLLNLDEIPPLVKTVKASHLLHFAWDVTPGKFWDSPQNEKWLTASMVLGRAFWKNGGARAVGIGTCAEYEWHKGEVICKEDETPLKPATPYGVSKHAAYLDLAECASQAGGSMAWARIFFQFGPVEPPSKLVASAINALLKNMSFKVGFSSQQRDWLYVQDVADACVALLESEIRSAVNIASGRIISNRQLIEKISSQIGGEAKIEFADAEPSRNNPASITPDVRLLFNNVKWQPRVSIDEGIKREIDFWTRRGL